MEPEHCGMRMRPRGLLAALAVAALLVPAASRAPASTSTIDDTAFDEAIGWSSDGSYLAWRFVDKASTPVSGVQAVLTRSTGTGGGAVSGRAGVWVPGTDTLAVLRCGQLCRSDYPLRWDVALYDVATEKLSTLVEHAAALPYLAASARGEVAYPAENGRTGGFSIRVVAAGKPARTLSVADSPIGLTWSPDGTRLAYEEENAFHPRLVVAGAGGSTDVGAGADPSWAPDGNTLLARDGRLLRSYDLAARTTRIVARLPAQPVGPALVSPDGTRAAVTLVHYPGHAFFTDVVLVELSSGAVTALTRTGDATAAGWSPDGRRVALTGRDICRRVGVLTVDVATKRSARATRLCARRGGGPGRQRFPGTPHADLLLGWGGNDDLTGGPRDDGLFGGTGDDVLRGGSGDDLLVPGPGHDLVVAGNGNDVVLAQDGVRDVVTCSRGVTTVFADRVDAVGRGCGRRILAPAPIAFAPRPGDR
jgi:hypothetical protein